LDPEKIVCTYPCCEKDAIYRVENEEGTAYVCQEHFLELKSLGLAGKTFRLEIPLPVEQP
jgi:hypothetical protein